MSRSLSIALLSHVASPRAPTGAERSLAVLAAGLRGRGHRVGVVLPASCALEPELRDQGVEVARIACRACWLAYYEPRPWPLVLARWLRFSWPARSTARIQRHLEHWGADAVHVNCLPHLRGALAAAATGRPVIWHVREILPPGPRRRWLARAVARSATLVVAVSQAVAEWIRAEGLADRLHVVPNGVAAPAMAGDGRVARQSLALAEGDVLFGLFGQLLPHKGALSFVEAGRRAAADEPKLRLLLAGAGPESFRRRVRQAIEATGCAERFILLPAEPSVERLVAACDVVCLTTTTPDPLPRAVLEGMAAGKPVATFDSGGAAEMVEHERTGLVVPAGDTARLAQAFVRLARDRELRLTMGRTGAVRAQASFSVERHVLAMEEIFRSVTR